MTGKNTAVFGLYPRVQQAERAVDELVIARFERGVSVLMADHQGSKDFAHEKQTKAPEGGRPASQPAARSAARWDCWPALAHWRSRASGRSSRQGRSGRLAGVGVGGAVGGLVGALVGMGIPEYEAKRYEVD